jgi:SAM-dependent methyltransferase
MTEFHPSECSQQDFCEDRRVLTNLQYRLLKRIAPSAPAHMSGASYIAKGKARALLGDTLMSRMQGKVVIDFGCGDGLESIELAKEGAAKVIGIDIRESALQKARKNASVAGVMTLCNFRQDTDEMVDVIVSLDSFEHFNNPESILSKMDSLLKPFGEVMISFGPPWLHPYGGHLFSVFPWAHLVFSEKALIRWRSDIRSDGARRFSEVEGGLNCMTIRRFESLVQRSKFRFDSFEAVPIRVVRNLHNRLTREFFTSVVRCRLVKRIRAF